MIRHTIHYDIMNIRKAWFIAFADDLLKIMREYWHMKRALREVSRLAECYKMMSISGYDVAERCKSIVSEVEKKVRL